ncbi:hypothetical protein O7634_16005 [Micromonospora sp. WMMD1120]|uniref:hypothetical protein n=1 Tax=Micromonospora sp. WMMD1120 TaxID=3016106 RepID=UPI00241755FE|nr:hypothetical protein [Micromonospora sp. WMMD1120]MDG4808257.1 hypothetical protein [Micromonospora sp. WMMD1120]
MSVSFGRKSAAVAVAALTALAVSACGTTSDESGGSDSPKQPSVLELLASDLKGSLQKTAEATDKSDSVTVSMSGTAGGEKVEMRGVLDLGEPVKAEMTTKDPNGDATVVRMIGAVIYVEIAEKDRAEMDGKRWMKMDLSEAGKQSGTNLGKQFEDVDPTKQVKTLLATEGTKVVGQETVNGAATVHYTVTSPIATYLQQVDEKLRAGVQQQMTKMGVKEITTDLWVDEQYRPRRAAMKMGPLGDLVMDYTDYGKPVTIETPPTAETLDFAEMLKGLQGLTAGN